MGPALPCPHKRFAVIHKTCFVKAASPSCTELETIVLDWLGKAIGLPKEFLTFPEETSKTVAENCAGQNDDIANEVQNGKGGGVLQASGIFVYLFLENRIQSIARREYASTGY